MKNTVISNIVKLYYIRGLLWFLLIMPVYVLFVQENGLNLTQVMVLQAIFSVIIVVMEVPSGYFADKFGRKNAVVCGCIIAFIGMLIYAFSHDFYGFLTAEILLGFSTSFISGADSALIYDTLLQSKREKEYKKIEGEYTAVGNFSEGIAAIIGGIIAATVSLRAPLYVEVIFIASAIPIAFTLKEPKKVQDIKTVGIRSLRQVLHYCLVSHQEMKWLIIYSAVISTATITAMWFIQPYLKIMGVPLVWFGIIWAVLQFTAGIFSILAHSFEKFLGRKNSLLLILIVTGLSYLALGIFHSIWLLAAFFALYFVRGIKTPIVKDYINKLASSNMRATILSVQNLAARLSFAAASPIIGWLADVYSLQQAFLLSGIFFALLGCIAVLFLSKHKVLNI